GTHQRLSAGDGVQNLFGEYGLSIQSDDPDHHPARIVNSNRPSAQNSALGSPNQAYGGRGVGAGGARDEPGANRTPLGNVLVLSDSNQGSTGPEAVALSKQAGKLIFEWSDPVHLDQLVMLNLASGGGAVSTADGDGKQVVSRALTQLGPNSVQSVSFRSDDTQPESDIAQLEVSLPPGAAVGQLSYSWSGRVRSDWERDHPWLAKIFYNPLTEALATPEIQKSIKLSLLSCTVTTILSLWVAIPIGYLLSRYRFFGRNLIDAILDIPIVLPPLVVGLSLLILFMLPPLSLLKGFVVYQVPAVIIAQFSGACAFAVRTMRATFDQIDARREQVALTLGCSRAQAFGYVVLPEAGRGVLTAGTLAWARALGEFGPLLIFAGTTRNKTEVLSTSVYLEISIGNLSGAVAVSMLMVVAAVIVLILARTWGTRALSI
ncbi:MAG: ABC transporter permease, partial [Planctomycetales bacterium]